MLRLSGMRTLRAFSQTANVVPSGAAATVEEGSKTGSSESRAIKVPGLSERCVKVQTGPVGPGASVTGEYKVPEYFSYDRYSFSEAEIEMAKYRLPQPSALKK